MKNITNPKEIQQMKDELFESRSKEQEQNNDFSFNDDGGIETCSNCLTPINSHGHCPRCDY